MVRQKWEGKEITQIFNLESFACFGLVSLQKNELEAEQTRLYITALQKCSVLQRAISAGCHLELALPFRLFIAESSCQECYVNSSALHISKRRKEMMWKFSLEYSTVSERPRSFGV